MTLGRGGLITSGKLRKVVFPTICLRFHPEKSIMPELSCKLLLVTQVTTSLSNPAVLHPSNDGFINDRIKEVRSNRIKLYFSLNL